MEQEKKIEATSIIKDENFFQISGWMLNKLNLSGAELLSYAVIFSMSQKSDFYGSANYIAKFIGGTVSGVRNAIDKLKAKKLVKKVGIHQIYGTALLKAYTKPYEMIDIEKLEKISHRKIDEKERNELLEWYQNLTGVSNFDRGGIKICQSDYQNLSTTLSNFDTNNKEIYKINNKEIEKEESLSQNQNQQIQQEFSATEIPLNYDVKKIYEQWCYYKLPSKNSFEFSTRFKDGIQYLRKNFITETDEILTAIKNYAEEKENSDFLKNLNWNFTAFANKIEKFIPDYYKKGCYGSLDKQKEKIDYNDPFWQEKETARKQEERKRQDEEIRKNGYVLPTLKNGKTIYRNELNQPLDEWGKIDIQELSNELKAEEKYMPEKFNERQIVMLGLVTYNGFCVPQELMTVKL